MSSTSNPYIPMALIQCERRPCYVYMKNDIARAMFHRWVDNPKIEDNSLDPKWWGGGCEIYGLVEFENGVVSKINPEYLTFADGGDFSETFFIPPERLNELVQKSDE